MLDTQLANLSNQARARHLTTFLRASGVRHHSSQTPLTRNFCYFQPGRQHRKRKRWVGKVEVGPASTPISMGSPWLRSHLSQFCSNLTNNKQQFVFTCLNWMKEYRKQTVARAQHSSAAASSYRTNQKNKVNKIHSDNAVLPPPPSHSSSLSQHKIQQ